MLVSEPGHRDAFPSVAFTRDGELVVTWKREDFAEDVSVMARLYRLAD